jgi:hypothetical protein
MADDDRVVTWLLEGDPAVRWRTLRDLTDVADDIVERERARIRSEGWGARLLAQRKPDGGWEGLYSPKWVSTTYTLLHLMWLGLPPRDPAVSAGLDQLWDWQLRWRVPETCIVSMLVRLTATFGHPAPRLDAVLTDLLDQQLDDGGWNCVTRVDKGVHGSFHTSIQALEALEAYRLAGGTLPTAQAQSRGRDFFLRHHLYRSHRTGEVAIAASTRFPAFPEWHFDVLRGLEHFADVRAPRDDRLATAVALLESKRHRDGRWPRYAPYAGRQWFELEPPGPSRWTTVRASRVLAWWQGGAPAVPQTCT